jgi:FkbH-like protein
MLRASSMQSNSEPESARQAGIKCVVWDLDETLWSGILLNGGAQILRPGVEDIVRTFDRTGILQSIASKNDHDEAWARLDSLGLAEFFLYPQINWDSKARSIETIAAKLNIGLDTIAFIDDQAAERDEVSHFHPEILTFSTDRLDGLLDEPRLKPRFLSAESKMRRSLYRADAEREKAEKDFDGKRDEFLASLLMRMTIRRADVDDLERAEELTRRTNQLNTSSQTYSFAELCDLVGSSEHMVLVCQLDDRYGSSGIIGLAVIDFAPDIWNVRLLLMSCRVMSRGVGSVFLAYILRMARKADVKVRAAFNLTKRNRPMLITLRFAGFQPTDSGDVLEHDLVRLPSIPYYVEILSDSL